MNSSDPDHRRLETLDRDLGRISNVELATGHLGRSLVGLGLALAFIVLVAVVATLVLGKSGTPYGGTLIVVVAAAFGAYMALNVGANDVANNMGPAVGARALTMGGALAIAAICETLGALLAGHDVVATVSRGIVAPQGFGSPSAYMLAMLSALLSSALWVNCATWIGAPVSTTHSVVGGVVGAGIAAAGFGAVDWPVMGTIALSWVVSPLIGGVIAAGFLWFIADRIIYRPHKIVAARRWVPLLIGLMAGAFVTYMLQKGLQSLVDIGQRRAAFIGLGAGLAAWAVMVPVIRWQSRTMENRTKALKELFTLPLIGAAALLSFAHGANDVANAVGPLAAIVEAAQSGRMSGAVSIPFWVMLVGALGISVGLLLFGPRLIRMVGNQITKLNPMRAYCVAMAASLTVILASWLGLPVSSTHIAVGGVFGVGFFREWYSERRRRKVQKARDPSKVPPPEERHRRRLVRRSHLMTIIAAWVITVPVAAGLAALMYLGLSALAM